MRMLAALLLPVEKGDVSNEARDEKGKWVSSGPSVQTAPEAFALTQPSASVPGRMQQTFGGPGFGKAPSKAPIFPGAMPVRGIHGVANVIPVTPGGGDHPIKTPAYMNRPANPALSSPGPSHVVSNSSIVPSTGPAEHMHDNPPQLHSSYTPQTPEEIKLASEPITKEKPLDEYGNSMTAGKLKLTFADGTQGVFKPQSGVPDDKPARSNISMSMDTEREIGAWEVAKRVGMQDMVPVVVERVVHGERGALLSWQEGEVAKNVWGEGAKFDGDKDLARAAVFDYVIGNEDRHGGNWVIDEDAGNKMRLIDHGLAFPDKGGYGDNTFSNHHIDAEVQHRYNGSVQGSAFSSNSSSTPHDFAKPYVDNKNDIMTALNKLGLPKGAVEGVGRRIDNLGESTQYLPLSWGSIAYE